MTTKQIRLLKALYINFSNIDIDFDSMNKFCKKYDAKLLIDKEDFDLLTEYKKNNAYTQFNTLTSKYFPKTFQKYFNNKYYTLQYSNNQKIIIPIFYDVWSKEKQGNLAGLRYYYDCEDNKLVYFEIDGIYIYNRSLLLPDRFIDFLVAHELAHAKRFLEKRVKIQNNKIVDQHEEFWADRELKHYLELINPKYKKRNERYKTIKISQILSPNRENITGDFTYWGRAFDKLVPFHNYIS